MAQTTIQGSFLGDATVTGAKIGADFISAQTALTTGLATTDEIIVSDAGVIKRIDISVWSASTETLTNKSIDLGTNTLTGSVAEFNTALQSESFATLGGTETLVAKTLTSPVLNTGVSGTAILDEDNLATNSATQLATQQSIKAYVDANAGTSVAGTTDNGLLTFVNSGSTFAAEANLTFTGSLLTVTGNIVPGANNSHDLGTSSLQWQNIYTQDFHLNNTLREEGNSIDGTKGDWTIQEGAEDLFIVNNETGKKYKFTLVEVA